MGSDDVDTDDAAGHEIDSSPPPSGNTNIRFVNTLDTKALVSMHQRNITIDPLAMSSKIRLTAPSTLELDIHTTCFIESNKHLHIDLIDKQAYDFLIGCHNNQATGLLISRQNYTPPAKSSLCVVVDSPALINTSYTLVLNGKTMWTNLTYAERTTTDGRPRCEHVLPKYYSVVVRDQHDQLIGSSNLLLGDGGVYVAVLKDSSNGTMYIYKEVEPKSVSMLWQIPQYFVITSGEILFSIT
ncbi:hypothetical protein QZH41_018275, partial [Actinostola sp. cb2023]